MLLMPKGIATIFLVSCVFLLSQCSKISTATPIPPTKPQQRLADPYPQSTSYYLTSAENQPIEKQSPLLIKAAGRFIKDGHWQEARGILSQMNELSPEMINQKSLLLAQIELMRGQPREALGILSSISDNDKLPLYEKIQYHELIASADGSISGIKQRILLDELLPDEKSKAKNRTKLWSQLTSLSPQELSAIKTSSKTFMGWIQLAQIAHTDYAQSANMLASVERWKTQYHEHPANQLLPSPLPGQLSNPPKKIALLLPTTGPLAGPGNAVKDGFMSSYQSSEKASSLQIKVYDTNQMQIPALYQKAINEGAEYIVGPLSKTEVASVASIPHSVPTLLLNEADNSRDENTYQLTLSPSYEATQAALLAHKKGYSRALVIAPLGSWADEVVLAFEKAWRRKGGILIDSLRFGINGDLNADFRHFLRISESEARIKQLKELLGQSIQATPSRRQDFDAIFLLAYSSKARQIIPLLNYYDAANIPIFATSAVYAGDPNIKRDRDLNDLMFCDIPSSFTEHLPNKNWPEQFNSYHRLYALGQDSYELSTQLNPLILFSRSKGGLSLKASHKIGRRLVWGQFKNGLAHRII